VQGLSIVEILTGLERRRALFQPMGVAISDDGNRVYVADFVWLAVFVFDFQAKEFRFIGVEDRFALAQPIGVALDAQENIYVSDSYHRAILVYTKNGQFLRAIGKGALVKPTGVALDKGRRRLYVVDTGHNTHDSPAHRVKVFDLEGTLIQQIGRRGKGNGEFNFPTYAAVDSQGRLYVVDSGHAQVQIFDPEGKFLWKFGEPGNKPGFFGRAKGVALDSFDNIYVTDSTWANIQVFNQKGELLLFFGGGGSTDGFFKAAGGIGISKDNTIYVSDTYGKKVNVYQLINTTAEDSLMAPEAIEKGGGSNIKGKKEAINLKREEVSKR
jgi:DNA-binding beta-propeller fold protein YncE